MAAAEGGQHAKAAAAALPFACDALLDEATAKIRVDQASLGAVRRLPEPLLVDALAAREPQELLGCVDRQWLPPSRKIYHP